VLLSGQLLPTSKMSTILRTLRNLRRIGFREAGHQMQYLGSSAPSLLVFISPGGLVQLTNPN
jgi:hypothetical protein